MTKKKIKDEMFQAEAVRAINDGENLRLQAEIRAGVADMPVNRIFLAYQFIDGQILPAIEKTKGKDCNDYQQFAEVARVLSYIIVLTDRDEYLRREIANVRLLAQFYQQRCAWLENELQKYTTLEDLLLTQSLEAYKTAVVKRAADLLTKKS